MSPDAQPFGSHHHTTGEDKARETRPHTRKKWTMSTNARDTTGKAKLGKPDQKKEKQWMMKKESNGRYQPSKEELTQELKN